MKGNFVTPHLLVLVGGVTSHGLHDDYEDRYCVRSQDDQVIGSQRVCGFSSSCCLLCDMRCRSTRNTQHTPYSTAVLLFPVCETHFVFLFFFSLILFPRHLFRYPPFIISVHR